MVSSCHCDMARAFAVSVYPSSKIAGRFPTSPCVERVKSRFICDTRLFGSSEERMTHPLVCLRRCFLIPAAPSATIWAGGSIKPVLPSSCMVVNNFMPAICSGSDNKELFLTSNEISCDSLSIEFNPINELSDTSKTVNPVMVCKLLGILDNRHSRNTNSVKYQQSGWTVYEAALKYDQGWTVLETFKYLHCSAEKSFKSDIAFHPIFKCIRRVFRGLDASRGKSAILFPSNITVFRKLKEFNTSARGSGCDK